MPNVFLCPIRRSGRLPGVIPVTFRCSCPRSRVQRPVRRDHPKHGTDELRPPLRTQTDLCSAQSTFPQ